MSRVSLPEFYFIIMVYMAYGREPGRCDPEKKKSVCVLTTVGYHYNLDIVTRRVHKGQDDAHRGGANTSGGAPRARRAQEAEEAAEISLRSPAPGAPGGGAVS